MFPRPSRARFHLLGLSWAVCQRGTLSFTAFTLSSGAFPHAHVAVKNDFNFFRLRAENSARLLCFRVLAFVIPYYIILPGRLCQYFYWVLKRAVL